MQLSRGVVFFEKCDIFATPSLLPPVGSCRGLIARNTHCSNGYALIIEKTTPCFHGAAVLISLGTRLVGAVKQRGVTFAIAGTKEARLHYLQHFGNHTHDLSGITIVRLLNPRPAFGHCAMLILLRGLQYSTTE